MKISSVDKTVQELLKSYYYRIPTFQRPYSWDKSNVEEFWNDVMDDDNMDYFIGSMVVFEYSDTTLGLVDGQQRLTTITMMLCAIRNIMREEGFHDVANGIHGLIARSDLDDKLRYTLQTDTSYPYLQQKIQEDPKNKSNSSYIKAGKEEKNLLQAFELLISKLRSDISKIKETYSDKVCHEKVEERLKEVRNRVLKLKVIYIELDNEADAYVVFETLNTRGKDLDIADLVKGYVVQLLHQEANPVDSAKETWKHIVKNVEKNNKNKRLSMSEFLYDYWLSRYPYTPKKKLYKVIKSKIDQNNVKVFLDDLYTASLIYRKIHAPDSVEWQKYEMNIKASLKAFQLFNVRQHVPIIMALLWEYQNKNLKKKTVEKTLIALESFHFVFTAIVSERGNRASRQFFAKHARELVNTESQMNKGNVLRQFVNDLKDKLPSFDDFNLNFQNLEYTNSNDKNRPLVHYTLRKFDEYYTSENGLVVDYDQMTIEHIAPQNPKDGKAEDNVGKLGNLILAEGNFNTKLGNKTFSEKIEMLRDSGIWLDDIVGKATNWDEIQIQERTNNLIGIAYNDVWQVKF